MGVLQKIKEEFHSRKEWKRRCKQCNGWGWFPVAGGKGHYVCWFCDGTGRDKKYGSEASEYQKWDLEWRRAKSEKIARD